MFCPSLMKPKMPSSPGRRTGLHYSDGDCHSTVLFFLCLLNKFLRTTRSSLSTTRGPPLRWWQRARRCLRPQDIPNWRAQRDHHSPYMAEGTIKGRPREASALTQEDAKGISSATMRESGRARKTKKTVADGERSSVGARLEGVRMLGYVTSKGSLLALKNDQPLYLNVKYFSLKDNRD